MPVHQTNLMNKEKVKEVPPNVDQRTQTEMMETMFSKSKMQEREKNSWLSGHGLVKLPNLKIITRFVMMHHKHNTLSSTSMVIEVPTADKIATSMKREMLST